MFIKLREDLDRYFFLARADSLWEQLKVILSTQGIWATIIYRSGSWIVQECPSKIVRGLLLPILSSMSKTIEIITGISLPFAVRIGAGLYIGHFGEIIIHPGVEIGDCCNISQGVAIGMGGRGRQMGVPRILNRVYIGPGAKIFGPIEIGNDVAVGANAVVTDSLPDRAVAVGVPAKIINLNGSSDFVVFRKKKPSFAPACCSEDI